MSDIRNILNLTKLEIIHHSAFKEDDEFVLLENYRDVVVNASEMRREMQAEIDNLKAQLEKAEKVIKHYADEGNWSSKGECEFEHSDLEDYTEIEYDHNGNPSELILVAQVGGERARQYFANKESK